QSRQGQSVHAGDQDGEVERRQVRGRIANVRRSDRRGLRRPRVRRHEKARRAGGASGGGAEGAVSRLVGSILLASPTGDNPLESLCSVLVGSLARGFPVATTGPDRGSGRRGRPRATSHATTPGGPFDFPPGWSPTCQGPSRSGPKGSRTTPPSRAPRPRGDSSACPLR